MVIIIPVFYTESTPSLAQSLTCIDNEVVTGVKISSTMNFHVTNVPGVGKGKDLTLIITQPTLAS